MAAPGGNLRFAVHLGTAENPIQDLYGIGFRLEMDTTYISSVTVDFSDSWLGQDEEIIGYDKFSDDFNHLGIAITRVDGQTRDGSGPIAEINIVVTDVILGIEADSTACLPLPLLFKYVLGTNAEGEDLLITSRSDSLDIKHPSQLTNTQEVLSEPKGQIQLFPNPTRRHLQMTYADVRGEYLLQLRNSSGQCVWQQYHHFYNHNGQIALQLPNLPPGLYALEILGTQQHLSQKLLIE